MSYELSEYHYCEKCRTLNTVMVAETKGEYQYHLAMYTCSLCSWQNPFKPTMENLCGIPVCITPGRHTLNGKARLVIWYLYTSIANVDIDEGIDIIDPLIVYDEGVPTVVDDRKKWLEENNLMKV